MPRGTSSGAERASSLSDSAENTSAIASKSEGVSPAAACVAANTDAAPDLGADDDPHHAGERQRRDLRCALAGEVEARLVRRPGGGPEIEPST